MKSEYFNRELAENLFWEQTMKDWGNQIVCHPFIAIENFPKLKKYIKNKFLKLTSKFWKLYVECSKTYFEVVIPLFSPWIFLSPSLDTTGITPFLKSSRCCKLSQTYFQLYNKKKFWFYNLKLFFENFSLNILKLVFKFWNL